MSLLTLSRVSLTLFALSGLFPIVGALFVANSPPRWLGMADVALAVMLFGVTAIVVSRMRRSVGDRHRLNALRITQIALGAVPVLIAAYFVVGDRINWAVLVIGLAWRLWLFLYSLPCLVAALQTDAG